MANVTHHNVTHMTPRVGGLGTSDVGSLVVITRTNTPVLRYSMQRVSMVFEIFKWGGLGTPIKGGYCYLFCFCVCVVCKAK